MQSTRVRSKPLPTSSRRAVISCTVPHSGMRALIRTGLMLKSSGASVLALLSRGSGVVQPDSPTCATQTSRAWPNLDQEDC